MKSVPSFPIMGANSRDHQWFRQEHPIINTGDSMKYPHCNKEFQEFKVAIIESERGWGSKVDEVKTFYDEDEALSFITEYNKKNDKPVTPDWYMYAKRDW